MEDHLAIEVIDHGSGFQAAPPVMPGPYAESGRGLAIMFALMDQVAIESTHNGTRVHMVKYFVR
jgi:anti-sigma regulatory factor (Ser/Thr protein kinase)